MRRKVVYTLVIILFSGIVLHAQPSISRQTFIYSVKGTDTLRLDKYDDTSNGSLKPCIVFVFGGGFVSGARDAENNEEYMRLLAENGYTAISIDYRLGLRDIKNKNVDGKKAMIALFENTIDMAVEDLFDATNFIYNHADEWNINRDMIIVNGSSAGAVTALQGEYYISNTSPLVQRLPKEFKYAGIIAFAGAIYSNKGKPKWQKLPCPIQLFHGDADSNVPFNKIKIFKYGLFGSKFIAEQLEKMKSPYYFYKVENVAHQMAVRPMKENITEINRFIKECIINKKPLQITADVTALDKPDLNKKFSIKDYIKANFGK